LSTIGLKEKKKLFIMRHFFLPFLLCLIFFIVPLQVFIISDSNTGIGIQGATYRFQVTIFGDSFIPITKEIGYITSGLYSGKTALSVILWALGTIALACTTIFSLIHAGEEKYFRDMRIFLGIITASGLYLGSCIIQYGFLLSGPAGISFPIGVILLLCWVIIYYLFPKFFQLTRG